MELFLNEWIESKSKTKYIKHLQSSNFKSVEEYFHLDFLCKKCEGTWERIRRWDSPIWQYESDVLWKMRQ